MWQVVLLLQRQFIYLKEKGLKCLLIHRKTWAGVLDGMVEIQWPWSCYTMRKAKTHREVACSDKKTWLNPDLGPDTTIWMKEVPDIYSFQMFETPADVCVSRLHETEATQFSVLTPNSWFTEPTRSTK